MSWLSELTGGIFLPLCCCTGWGIIEEGASRHAFTVANRFSAQWQNLALGLRFHCVLVGGEQLSMSQREGWVHVRSLVCPRSTLVEPLSSYFLRGCSVSLWRIHSVWRKGTCGSQKAEQKKQTYLHIPYQWVILSKGPYSPTPQRFSVRHTRAQFLHPPFSLRSGYTTLSLSNLIQKLNIWYCLRAIIWITVFMLVLQKKIWTMSSDIWTKDKKHKTEV